MLSGAQSISYGYDTRGNVVQRAGRGFVFDDADRIVATTSGGITDESYRYDGHGRRVAIQRGSDTTYQVYSKAGQLLAEQSPGGQFTNYVYLNGSLIARTGAGAAQVKPTIAPNPSWDGVYTVSWTAISGATQYQLLQSTNGGAETVVYSGAALSWSPTAPKPTGQYGYRVAACNPTCTNPGERATVTVLRKPAQPPGASPNPSTTGSYTVSWIAEPAAAGYRLDERQGAGAWNDGVYYGVATNMSFSGKTNGQWFYRLSLCNAPGSCGGSSNELMVTVQPAGVEPPSVPSNVTLPESSTDGDFTLAWSSAPRATGYNVQEQFNGGAWQVVANNQPGTSWSPQPPKTRSGAYTYQVQACNSGGCSAWSSAKSVKVNVVPAPTNVKALPPRINIEDSGNHQYTVSWSDGGPPGSYTYNLQETNSGCAVGPAQREWTGLTARQITLTAQLPASCERITYAYSVRACDGSPCSDSSDSDGTVEVLRAGAIPTHANAIGTIYFHTDALGSPVAQTDANGAVIKRRGYQPWGAPADGSYEQGPGYTGHVTDALTGLSYMQQRYYDPVAGRFLSVDPVTPNTANGTNFNRYWYANNNPYRYIDPDGRQSYEDLNLTGMAAGEMLRNGEMTEAEYLDAWAQGAAAGGKGLAIGATIAIPGPEDIAIAVSASRLLLAARASKGISQALRYVESVAERIGPTGGRSGIRTVEYSGKGGEKGAAKLFDTLTGGKSAPRDGGRLGKLSDGSHVQMSTKTHADGTIETSVRIMSDRTGSHIKDVNKIRFKH